MELRVARPVGDLEGIARMYASGLGLEEVGRFEDHDGFDGVMVGGGGLGYHLEFTSRRGHEAGGSASDEHLLVFYEPDREACEARWRAMESAGFVRVASANPYWEVRGRTYEDAEGYRVVIQNASWSSGS